VRWISAEVVTFDELIVLHVTQTAYKSSAADGKQSGKQFKRALWPVRKISNDEHRPLVAEHLQGARYGTTIEVTPFHVPVAYPFIDRDSI